MYLNLDILNKLIVILGPTTSGKTSLSIKLAKKYNGEVISADSRQVYRGMDIGSGKITKKEMKGIPHHLLDVANPKRKFTVSQYQKLALKAIKNIQKKNKIPFLVGGSPFYIQSVVGGIKIPEVKPDWKLRKKLEKLTTEQMFKKLKKLDPVRAKSIDRHNPRRLIRALEIVLKTGKPVPAPVYAGLRPEDKTEILQISIKKTPDELKKLIKRRLLKRLKNNAVINEVKKLRASGLSWKRLEEFGLEYRSVAQYIFCNVFSENVAKYPKVFQCPFTYQEMINKIQKESEHFAKRQMTWFKKDKQIRWVKNYKEAKKSIKKFLR